MKNVAFEAACVLRRTLPARSVREDRILTIHEAIAYINAHTWSQWKLGLSRTRELLARLGDPQKKLRFVHVAGSNGKGSTCAILERILREAGYVTGFYPSPYIEDFRERIQVCGEYITEEALCRITARVREQADAMEDHPTQFELITAIGMVYFAEKMCDVVVLEVGLGGTFDSTNVIDAPEAAVITNIGLEHTEYLGNTLAEIAGNKCGIIKPGSDVVCYENVPEVMEVVRRICSEKGCSLKVASFGRIRPLEHSLDGQTFRFLREAESAEKQCVEDPEQGSRERTDCSEIPDQGGWERTDCRETSEQGSRERMNCREIPAIESENSMENSSPVYRLALLGEYQLHNAATALTAVEVLQERGFWIPEGAVRRGLANVRWPARFEVLSHDPLFILDGGHNPQCAAALAQSLETYLQGRKVVFLMGMLADKDYRTVIDTIAPSAAAFACLTPDSPRALPAQELAQELGARGFAARPCGTAEDAVRTAFGLARSEPGLSSEDTGFAKTCTCEEKADTAAPGTNAIYPETDLGNDERIPLPVVAFGSLYMAGAVRTAFRKMQGGKHADESTGGEKSGISADAQQPVSRTAPADRDTVLAGPAADCTEEKQKQRRLATESRRALTAEQRAEKSAEVCRLLRTIPVLQEAKTVFSYASSWDEVNLDAINRELEEQGKTVCYPLTYRDGSMEAVLPGTWRTGAFGIREPVREQAVPVDPARIDVVLVPCVAFDRLGGRCGHGAGYYDRFLSKLSGRECKILIAYDAQEMDKVVTEATDVRMDMAVTETGILAF